MPLKTAPLLNEAFYNPDALLDRVSKLLDVKNDAGLAKRLDVAPPVISKIRHRRMQIGGSFLIRLHEVTELSIKELRTLMGDHADRYRPTGRSAHELA